MALYPLRSDQMLPAAGPPSAFEQILGTRDCDPAIGELVLSADVARLFAPGDGDGPFDYNATLELIDGRRVVVRAYRTVAGQEALLREGWRGIVEDYNLKPGDFARFHKSSQENSTFSAVFQDPDGNNRLSRLDMANDPPPAPELRFEPDVLQWSPEFGTRSRGGRRRGEQAAGAAAAAAWGVGAFQRADMTIKEAMDLAVECGAREGSDEHYMATKLFVKAENRARLQWLRRCYEDQMN